MDVPGVHGEGVQYEYETDATPDAGVGGGRGQDLAVADDAGQRPEGDAAGRLVDADRAGARS